MEKEIKFQRGREEERRKGLRQRQRMTGQETGNWGRKKKKRKKKEEPGIRLRTNEKDEGVHS